MELGGLQSKENKQVSSVNNRIVWKRAAPACLPFTAFHNNTRSRSQHKMIPQRGTDSINGGINGSSCLRLTRFKSNLQSEIFLNKSKAEEKRETNDFPLRQASDSERYK